MVKGGSVTSLNATLIRFRFSFNGSVTTPRFSFYPVTFRIQKEKKNACFAG